MSASSIALLVGFALLWGGLLGDPRNALADGSIVPRVIAAIGGGAIFAVALLCKLLA